MSKLANRFILAALINGLFLDSANAGFLKCVWLFATGKSEKISVPVNESSASFTEPTTPNYGSRWASFILPSPREGLPSVKISGKGEASILFYKGKLPDETIQQKLVSDEHIIFVENPETGIVAMISESGHSHQELLILVRKNQFKHEGDLQGTRAIQNGRRWINSTFLMPGMETQIKNFNFEVGD